MSQQGSSVPVFRGSGAAAAPAALPNPGYPAAAATAATPGVGVPNPHNSHLFASGGLPAGGALRGGGGSGYNSYSAAPSSYGGSAVDAGPFGQITLGEGATRALAQAQQYSEQVDELLGRVGAPVKPWLPAAGRFLMVATFFEDGLRLVSQWSSQVNYIWKYRGLPKSLTVLFLALNVVCMFAGSGLIVLRRQLIYGVGALGVVVVSQALVYGLIFDGHYFFRDLSIIGGLLIVVSDAFVRDRRALSMPGLPMLDHKDHARYFQLAGRILLILLYLFYALTDATSLARAVGALFGFAACVCVAVGFKARLSASLLVLMLVWRNMTSNKYWDYESSNPVRDFLRYEHFQVLSIVGGLLLVVNSGAGAISVDEKKKIY